MLEIIAGVVVAFAALTLVLEPLLRAPPRPGARRVDDADDVELIDLEESDSLKIRALLALKEIEFDRATGKLSDEDYEALKAKYSAAALAAIHAEASAQDAASADLDHVAEADSLDPAEAAVRRVRARVGGACPVCGPRPEPGAVYCSSCGRSLTRADALPRCWICGAAIPGDARFCPSCGKAIAA